MNRQERRKLGKGRGDSANSLALGFAQYRRGNFAGAEVWYRQVLRDEPENPEALRMMGELLADKGRLRDAVEMLQQAVKLQPKDFRPIYSLGNAYRLAGQDGLAMRCYQAALAEKPGFAGALHGMGACLRKAEREREAAECFRQAVRAQPDWAVAWKDMGLTLAMLGEMQLAEAALRRAAELQPDLGDAQRHLAAIRQDQAAEAEIAALEQKIADPDVRESEKVEILFALGQSAEKAGRYEAAFEHFAAGNALLRARQEKAGHGFDRARMTTDVDGLIAAFTPEVFAEYAGLGNESEAPVFIVGMPRAGSTLFEQIAASHSQVFGGGERFGIGEIAQRFGVKPGPGWTRENLRDAAEKYLAWVTARAGGARLVVDKMPDNIFLLGLIAVLFPNARVIFCDRDARDVAISCFFQNFAKSSGFDTDLSDAVFRTAEVARLTAHWQRVLPIRHMTLGYEALLADLEGESRRLIAFLGLEWERQCLEFHKTVRPVRTASWAQVRRPLYQSSVGRWRNYAAEFEKI